MHGGYKVFKNHQTSGFLISELILISSKKNVDSKMKLYSYVVVVLFFSPSVAAIFKVLLICKAKHI